MECRHNDCTLFEGGVEKMPGKIGYSYMMCSNCHSIIAYREDSTDIQWWKEGVYKLEEVWSKLDKQKEIDRLKKRIDVLESEIKTIKIGDKYYNKV